MAEYRIFTFERSGCVVAASQISLRNDEDAFAFASEVLVEGETAEAWHGARYVGTVSAPSCATEEPQPLKRVAGKD